MKQNVKSYPLPLLRSTTRFSRIPRQPFIQRCQIGFQRQPNVISSQIGNFYCSSIFFSNVILLLNDSGNFIFYRYWQPAVISSNHVSMIKWMRILRPFFYQSLTYLSSGEIHKQFTFLLMYLHTQSLEQNTRKTKLLGTSQKSNSMYSDLPNNRAANLTIIFWGKKHLHKLIRTYTFINF